MKLWVTELQAIKPSTGELTKYCGPDVPGETFQDAVDYCENNGLGYCTVLGELVAEVSSNTDDMVDYEGKTITRRGKDAFAIWVKARGLNYRMAEDGIYVMDEELIPYREELEALFPEMTLGSFAPIENTPPGEN